MCELGFLLTFQVDGRRRLERLNKHEEEEAIWVVPLMVNQGKLLPFFTVSQQSCWNVALSVPFRLGLLMVRWDTRKKGGHPQLPKTTGTHFSARWRTSKGWWEIRWSEQYILCRMIREGCNSHTDQQWGAEAGEFQQAAFQTDRGAFWLHSPLLPGGERGGGRAHIFQLFTLNYWNGPLSFTDILPLCGEDMWFAWGWSMCLHASSKLDSFHHKLGFNRF